MNISGVKPFNISMLMLVIMNLGPRDMRMMLAAVPFQTGTSIFFWVPSSSEIVIS